MIQALQPPGVRLALDCVGNSRIFTEEVAAVAAPGDSLLFHIDLTEPGRLPYLDAEVVADIQRLGVITWNSRVTDISKATIQVFNASIGLPSTRASLEGPDDLLIVKTNHNAFGVAEGRLLNADRDRFALPSFEDPLLDYLEYPVMRRSSIPKQWWNNRSLSIETFIRNEEGEFFRMYLVGEKIALCACTSNLPVKRTRNTDSRINYLLNRKLAFSGLTSSFLPRASARALATGLAFSESFRLDFGAIDLVRDDGENVYVVDVNATPWWGSDEQPGILEHLSKGFA
jgi:hypothetical protein